MSKETVEFALKTFGEQEGLGSLRFEEDGTLCMESESGLIVHILYDEPACALLVFVELGRLTEEAPRELLHDLLNANVFWGETGGSTLSMDRKSGAVLLAFQEPSELASPERLKNRFLEFLPAAEHWRSRLQASPVLRDFSQNPSPGNTELQNFA